MGNEKKLLYCSFCNKSQHEVRKLVAGPSVFICDECVTLSSGIIKEECQDKIVSNLEACSFCGDEKDKTKKLVQGRRGYICNQCIEQSVDILSNDGYVFSFNQIRKLELEKIGLKPIFEITVFDIRDNHCFYLCPFREPFNTIYLDHVIPASLRAGYSIERADEIYGLGPVINDIWKGINSSTLILADISTKNPNVLYEIGIAHTVGKPVIIMTQSMDDVPFDLRHHRCIVYEYTPRGIKELESRLENTLKAVSR